MAACVVIDLHCALVFRWKLQVFLIRHAESENNVSKRVATCVPPKRQRFVRAVSHTIEPYFDWAGTAAAREAAAAGCHLFGKFAVC